MGVSNQLPRRCGSPPLESYPVCHTHHPTCLVTAHWDPWSRTKCRQSWESARADNYHGEKDLIDEAPQDTVILRKIEWSQGWVLIHTAQRRLTRLPCLMLDFAARRHRNHGFLCPGRNQPLSLARIPLSSLKQVAVMSFSTPIPLQCPKAVPLNARGSTGDTTPAAKSQQSLFTILEGTNVFVVVFG
jgi:hypothetical protein